MIAEEFLVISLLALFCAFARWLLSLFEHDQEQVSQRQVDHSEQPAPYKIEGKGQNE